MQYLVGQSSKSFRFIRAIGDMIEYDDDQCVVCGDEVTLFYVTACNHHAKYNPK